MKKKSNDCKVPYIGKDIKKRKCWRPQKGKESAR